MPIKIAVIGLGYWGPNLLRNFYQLENCEVNFACDINREKLSKVKKIYPAINITQDYKDILKDENVQAICIATSLATHFAIAKEALLAGKHVLIEKPIASSSAEAEELIQLAKEKNRVLMVDYTFVYTGAVRKIKELIDKGELGKIYYYDSERVNLGLVRSDTNVIWDLASHDVAIIDYLIKQKPINVSTSGSSHVFDKKEEMAHVILEHEEGLMSYIRVSWLSPLKIRRVLLGGDKKMVLYDDVEPTEKIKIYDRGVDIDPSEVTPFAPLYRSGDIVIPKLDQTEALEKVAEHFMECIRESKRPLTDGESGLRVVKILEAANRSIENGGMKISL